MVAVTNSYPAERLRAAQRIVATLEGLTPALLRGAVPRLMPSKFLDPEQAKRHAEHRYDFGRKSLGGKVVLIPGGAGGLGAAITALLLQEGALPVVGYRTQRGRALAFQQKMQDLYGGPITLVEGDIGEAEARERYLKTALDVKGDLYGLVALPGDPARVKPAELRPSGARARRSRANYEAPVLLARAAAEAMTRKATKGAIVLFSSMQGVHPFEGSLAYAGPKAALRAGRAHPGQGVRRRLRHPRQRGGPGGDGCRHGSRLDRRRQIRCLRRARRDPALRPPRGRGQSGAAPARADSYITGQVITVDGGLTLRRDRSV